MGPRAMLGAGLEGELKRLGWEVETNVLDELVTLSHERSVYKGKIHNPNSVGAYTQRGRIHTPHKT